MNMKKKMYNQPQVVTSQVMLENLILGCSGGVPSIPTDDTPGIIPGGD